MHRDMKEIRSDPKVFSRGKRKRNWRSNVWQKVTEPVWFFSTERERAHVAKVQISLYS